MTIDMSDLERSIRSDTVTLNPGGTVQVDALGGHVSAGDLNENWLVSIGNTDDRLTQEAWSHFIQHVADLLDAYRVAWHGRWYSSPTDPWQNANFCFQLPGFPTLAARMQHAQDLEGQLAITAGMFCQDSIAVTRGPVRFLRPPRSGYVPVVRPLPRFQVYG